MSEVVHVVDGRRRDRLLRARVLQRHARAGAAALSRAVHRHRRERLTHLSGGLEALRRAFGQRLHHDELEALGELEIRPDLGERSRRLLEVLLVQLVARLAIEREPPGQHAVEHASKRIEVGPAVHPRTDDLLWSHVLWCSTDLALFGDEVLKTFRRLEPRHRAGLVVFLLDVLRDAEIEDLHVVRVVVLLAEEEIVGLQVPMHRPLLVRMLEGLEDLVGDMERLRDAHPLDRQGVVQDLAVQQLHHQVELSIVGGAVVVDDETVGVAQVRRDARAARESFGRSVIRGREDLHGDEALGAHLPGLPYRGVHASDADQLLQPVATRDDDPGQILDNTVPVASASLAKSRALLTAMGADPGHVGVFLTLIPRAVGPVDESSAHAPSRT